MWKAIFLPIFLTIQLTAGISESYEELRKKGIVSGFGVSIGNPNGMINRIRAIESPKYIGVKEEENYLEDDLCIGTKIGTNWVFAPIFILNRYEIVNHKEKNKSILYCPLAGLSLSLGGEYHISGLLKWDTFVLFDKKNEDLVLPLAKSNSENRYYPVHQLTIKGVRKYFPGSLILKSGEYSGDRKAYGSYPEDERMGIGHDKPQLKKGYSIEKNRWHPKEKVMIVGFDNDLVKIYPLIELKKKTKAIKGNFTDQVTHNDKREDVIIYFDTEVNWAYARQIKNEKEGQLINKGFAYIFAMLQHLPDIEIYKAE